MSSFETHFKKYEMFKRDAENEDNSPPTRIEAYFASAFHLTEACMAKEGFHINKHQMLRRELERIEIFEEDTATVWRNFQKIENQIRPGQTYGGKIDGKALRETKRLFYEIEEICLKKVKK